MKCIYWQLLALVIIVIYNVGFCVVRSTPKGNSRASDSGTDSKQESSRFFLLEVKAAATDKLFLSIGALCLCRNAG